MADFPVPVKNVQYIFYVGLIDQSNTKLLKASPTIAAGDFKVSTDGGAFANLGTLPTVTPAAGTSVKITLSTSEMNGDNVVVTCIDAAGAEWCDQLVNIQTAARGIADLAYPATSGRSMVVDASGLVDANAVKLGPTGAGTAQTARDVGASVLLSSGTGTGQLDFTSGVVKGNVVQWLGTAASTPTVAGVPNVNVKTWNDLATVALPLVPTVAGRTLDVSATGEGGVDWANVGSPTTAVNLSGTTIAVTQKVDVDTIKTNPVVNGGTITFPTTATLASTTNITAGTITTATNLTNAPTSGDFTATMKTSIGTAVAASAVASVTAGCTLTTGERNSVADALLDRTDGVETSLSPRGALRLITSASAAKLSGAATTTVTIRNVGDTKDRITATVDSSGNRSAVTTDAT